jgi:hypothetical protein
MEKEFMHTSFGLNIRRIPKDDLSTELGAFG